MKPYIFWHWNRLPTLGEADAAVASMAARGFGIIILPEAGFLSPAFFEALRGACRSAGRFGARLFVADDCAAFSGCGGGEVTSVPYLRASRLSLVPVGELAEGEAPLLVKNGLAAVARRAEPENGVCPADVFRPRAARAFAESVYRRVLRETRRFTGHELLGFYTKNPFPDGFLPYSEALAARAAEEGMSLESVLFGGDGEKYLSLANRLATEALIAALREEAGTEKLRVLTDAACSGGERLSTVSLPSAGRRFYAEALKALCLGFRGGSAAADGDAVEARLPLAARRPCADFDGYLACAAENLGSITAGMEEVSPTASADNPAVTVRQFSGSDAALYIFVNTLDEAAACRCLLCDPRPACVCDIASGEVYAAPRELSVTLSPGGCLAVMCGGGLSPEPPALFTRSGALLGELTGGEELILHSIENGVYRVTVPELAEGRGLLRLEGDFDCASVRIGRRTERLAAEPFLVPLYSADAGRTAEIALFSTAEAGESVTGETEEVQTCMLNSVHFYPAADL